MVRFFTLEIQAAAGARSLQKICCYFSAGNLFGLINKSS